MKTQFGFIKCCERPGELFFHNSALQDGPEGFAVGQDVEFSVTREPKGERPNAVEYAVFSPHICRCYVSIVDSTSRLLASLTFVLATTFEGIG